jgi:N-acetyl-anhydromuramyl-L-alanine amidase AmpD
MSLKPENIQYLIIHHTATARDKTTFAAVKRYHVSKGWGDIGYHYFITADGKVWPGRSENTIGAHARASSMNYKSLGICLTGNFMKEVPTYEQLQSLHDLLLKLIEKYKISKDNVLGHREVPKAATACPGDFLLEWIEKFRKEKSEVKTSPQIAKVIDHLEQAINILKSL